VEPGTELLAWLNSLPKVQRVLAAEFDGKAINDPNLSAWKQGGHQDWLEQQDVLEAVERIAEDGTELTQASKESLADQMAVWLQARYLAAVRRLKTADAGDERTWARLKECCDNLVRLRRGDQQSRQLRMAEERWARKKEAEDHEQGKSDEQLTPEERQQRIREIYGRI